MEMGRLKLKKLNEGKVNEQYQGTTTNKSAAMENLPDIGYIYRARNTIRQNIRISTKDSLGYCESKHHK
jgi:hypothetical protein